MGKICEEKLYTNLFRNGKNQEIKFLEKESKEFEEGKRGREGIEGACKKNHKLSATQLGNVFFTKLFLLF